MGVDAARLGTPHRKDTSRPTHFPKQRRFHETTQYAPPVEDERLFQVVDVLSRIAEETGKAIPQIAISWLVSRPTISSVIMGARNEDQLRQNLGSAGWELTIEQRARLDAVSSVTPPYPYFPYYRQAGFAKLSPPVVPSEVTNAAA